MHQYSVVILKMLINLFYMMTNVRSMHCTKWLQYVQHWPDMYITVQKKCKNTQK